LGREREEERRREGKGKERKERYETERDWRKDHLKYTSGFGFVPKSSEFRDHRSVARIMDPSASPD